MNPNQPVRVAVTGAAGQIAYNLLFSIAAGQMFGPRQPVILQLLEIPPALPSLRGTAMELEDCAFPLLRDIICTDSPETAFREANWVLLVGAKPRVKGQERKDLILDNGPIFTGQGKALAKAAASDIRILVVGNPCNTNCLIARSNGREIPDDRWFAMTRLDHNRAVAQLARKAGASVTDVSRVTIWGNHSATQFPDYFHAQIQGKPAAEVIKDARWLEEQFIPIVQKRGATVIEARGKSSAASAANAVIDHVRSLSEPSPRNDWTSAAVVSDGSYDIPKGLLSSFPIRSTGKGWEIVQGLSINDFARNKISASIAELEEERQIVKGLLGG